MCTKEMEHYAGCMYIISHNGTHECDLCRKEQQAFEVEKACPLGSSHISKLSSPVYFQVSRCALELSVTIKKA